MKKIYMLGIMFVLLNSAGCVSYYNHSRVQENIIKEAAIANNDVQTLKLITSGVSAKRAVQIKALSSNGEVTGMAVGFDVYDVGNYFKTFKEAPVSSTLSLLADAAAAYGTYLLADEIDQSTGDRSRDTVTITAGGDVTIISSDNASTSSNDVSTDNSSTSSSTAP